MFDFFFPSNSDQETFSQPKELLKELLCKQEFVFICSVHFNFECQKCVFSRHLIAMSSYIGKSSWK